MLIESDEIFLTVYGSCKIIRFVVLFCIKLVVRIKHYLIQKNGDQVNKPTYLEERKGRRREVGGERRRGEKE